MSVPFRLGWHDLRSGNPFRDEYEEATQWWQLCYELGRFAAIACPNLDESEIKIGGRLNWDIKLTLATSEDFRFMYPH